jgi:hypothetical protein
MKSILSYSLLAAAMAAGVAYGQATTATTTPVGYNSTVLQQGFNVVGITVQASTATQGNFEAVAASSVTDSNVEFAATPGRIYVLEILSGTLAGVLQEIPAASISASSGSTTISTPQDLVALGLAVGDKYRLRLAPTLEEVFTTVPFASGGVLKAALNAVSSDNVWIPNSSGGYDKYFLRSGATPAFQKVSGSSFVAAPNVPLIYSDGMLIEKRDAAPATLTISGEVKTVGTTSVATQGFNLISVVAPVGLTLRTAGLEANLKPALNAVSADNVWVQQADLSYKKYFRRGNATTATWRDVSNPTVDLDPSFDPVLPTAILIERRDAGAVNIKLGVPASYSSL